LSFVAQVTEMGRPFVLFSLILLPCLFFIGLVTFVRAVQVAIEDMVHARGMARIRHYFVELTPVLQRYLVNSPMTIPRRCWSTRASGPHRCNIS
jgi:hypothetical protein